MPRLSTEDRIRLRGHLEAGVSPRRVAAAFNVHLSTVYRLQERLQATGSTADRLRSGRPRVTTARQDRFIVRQHLQNRFQAATVTASNLPGGAPQRVASNTVRRRLAEQGLASRRPARGPVLTQRHRQARLQWAQARINWRGQQWGRVIFTDESRFCLHGADGRVRVWRRGGERYRDNCVLERDPWGGPSVMVWGGIGLHQRIGPIIFHNAGQGRGNGVNAQRFIHEVLRPHVVPFWANHQNFFFQQDNAPIHTARATQQFLQANNINTLPWPALSPDLNPIEHLWDEIQRRLNQVRPRPATAAQLGQAIVQVWTNIPAARINRLVLSMYRRCRAVVNANGGHTRY